MLASGSAPPAQVFRGSGNSECRFQAFAEAGVSAAMRFFLFILLWIATFPIAWKMLPALLFRGPDDYKHGRPSWIAHRISYMAIIVTPYLVLLTADGVGAALRTGIVGLVLVVLSSTTIKLFFAEQVASYLWLVYGYVYNGLRSFFPYMELIGIVVKEVTRGDADEHPNILDLGCGTGNLARELASTCAEFRYIGVDTSGSMIRVAMKRIGEDPRVQFVHDDMLAFCRRTPSASYDLVLLINSLYSQQDQDRLLVEVRRILRNQGQLVIVDPTDVGNLSLIRHHLTNDRWLKLLDPRLIAIWIIDNFISELSRRHVFVFRTGSELGALVARHGLHIDGEPRRVYGGGDRGICLLIKASVRPQHD